MLNWMAMVVRMAPSIFILLGESDAWPDRKWWCLSLQKARVTKHNFLGIWSVSMSLNHIVTLTHFIDFTNCKQRPKMCPIVPVSVRGVGQNGGGNYSSVASHTDKVIKLVVLVDLPKRASVVLFPLSAICCVHWVSSARPCLVAPVSAREAKPGQPLCSPHPDPEHSCISHFCIQALLCRRGLWNGVSPLWVRVVPLWFCWSWQAWNFPKNSHNRIFRPIIVHTGSKLTQRIRSAKGVGGYPLFPLKVFGQDDFPLRGGGGTPQFR